MLDFFYQMYLSMLVGTWQTNAVINNNATRQVVSTLGQFLTSLFNNVDTPMQNLGDYLVGFWPNLVALILSTITSIGIVVMAVKGVKKAFGIFFMGIRR